MATSSGGAEAEQDRALADVALREGERADLGGALGELDRVEDHHGAAGGPVALDLSERRGRAAAREDRGLALDVRQRIRGRGLVEAALAAEVRRQAHRDARAAGDQREIGGTGAEVDQMAFADRIGDRLRMPAARSSPSRARIAAGPLVDHGMRQQPDRPRLCRCSTRTRLLSVIGVSGWWRMWLSESSWSPTNRWPR